MSVYVYNLGFSTSDAYGVAGQFEPYASSQVGLNQSSAWFQYNVPGQTPPGVSEGMSPITTPLNSAQWNFVQQNGGSSGMTLKTGDYVLLRFFPFGSNPTCNLRATAVVGRGTSIPAAPGTQPSSPFATSSSQPRPVVDFDNSPGSNWPQPTASDGSWTFCVGMIHGVAADYSMNIGASIYVTSGGQQGTVMAYGQDPQMHVVTTVPAVSAA